MATYHLTSKTTIEQFRNDLLKYVVEYNKRCKQCRKYLGTWAYGKWNH